MLLGAYKTRIVIFFPNRLIIVSLHNASLRNTSSLKHALFDVTLAAAGFFCFFWCSICFSILLFSVLCVLVFKICLLKTL